MNSPPLTMQARDPSYLPRGAAHGRPPRTSAFEPILPSDDLKRCLGGGAPGGRHAQRPRDVAEGQKRHHVVGRQAARERRLALSELAGRAPRQLLRRRDHGAQLGIGVIREVAVGLEVHISGSWLPLVACSRWGLHAYRDARMLRNSSAVLALGKRSRSALRAAADGQRPTPCAQEVVEAPHVLTPPPRRPTREERAARR